MLGHYHRDCRHPFQEAFQDRMWYVDWMQAGPVAKTSIVWMMIKEKFVQEEDKTSMLNILLDHSSKVCNRDEGLSKAKLGEDGMSTANTCVASEGFMQ